MRKVKIVLKWLAAMLVAASVTLLAVHFFALDGLAGSAMALLSTDQGNTEYAAGYSDWKLRWVKLGSSKQEVLTQLGAPLNERDRLDDGQTRSYWYYTKARKKADYQFRLLVFDKEGRLIEKHSEFYID